MGGHFMNFPADASAAPSGRILRLRLLSDEEERQISLEWNDTGTDYPADRCVHYLFEAQVTRTPDRIAAISEQDHLSYCEFNRRSNRLARRLQANGLRAGAPLGLLRRRSIETLVAVVAVLKTGAACLPLDPSYPDERLAFMISDSGAKLVVSEESLASRAREFQARVVCYDRSDEIDVDFEDPNLKGSPPAELAAYLIFKWGPTGKPKGVAMPHRALVNLADWHRRTEGAGVRTLQYASLNFDVSFQEMFATWHTGGTLVMIQESERIDAGALRAFLDQYGIERFHMPSVILQSLAAEFAGSPGALHTVREMMVRGEQLEITPEIAALLSRLSGCALYNHYGPSETHVVTSHLHSGEPGLWPSLPPLGRPIANVRVFILDQFQQSVPAGVPGELYIGGVCLSHGYLGRSAATAERFIPDRFGQPTGSRLYRTGDLGRFLQNGEIEFVGRSEVEARRTVS